MIIHLYIPGNSIIHRAPFLLKVLLISTILTITYLYRTPYVLGSSFLLCLLAYRIAHIPILELLRLLRFFLSFLLIMTAVNIFLRNSIATLLLELLSIITALGFGHLLSLSTPLNTILKETRVLFTPLRIFGIPDTIPALLISIILRSIPLLAADLHSLQRAFALRGGKRWRSFLLLIPLLIQAIQQSQKYADALILRGFKFML